MLRRLHKEQPSHFAFTPANQTWAEGQITKYPEGRQASAIIPLFWRAQEQEGWLTRAAIEHVCNMLGMPFIRGLEVATFYFMFKLEPRGTIANIQICGTTSCMICGAEDLVAVCKELIAEKPHTVSADGKFSWEEVECLGACSNAPMAQIGKDYYEDLTPDSLRDLIARFSKGEVPVPGPQNGRYAAEPLGGLTSLKDHEAGRKPYNASAQAAVDIGDTVKRIDGTEVPILTPWLGKANAAAKPSKVADKPMSKAQEAASDKAATTDAVEKARPPQAQEKPVEAVKPEGLTAARDGKADDLKLIKGVGPKLEKLCNSLGFYHFDQIANWTPEQIVWVDENLEGFKGRVTRDTWVAQAKILAAGGETEFSRRNDKGSDG
ncbi:NADH-quinone oxidoreductase subunit NuoE [Pseudorhodobacter turbinis]|uniref:NADH-quinone oxidoreductase subunit NuoE n=1 Tax=Pseudorhodobacter turbinis TaxID=2500533 RepID=A0A4P8EDD7_9RHOB|nr:NADH-quinone oxidoreductase subunit NuoE [Pseudorhodobacter turbinis]QCO54950.1 NADH-quinone oxidoreductase subunit NuoE [Pseudorhodobacter turbinis]